MLGPLLFNIFVNDLFVSNSNLHNYDDHSTLCTSDYNLEEVEKVLLNDSNEVTEWFFQNSIVLNAGKCNFMCLGKTIENETFIFKYTIINNNKEKKICVTIDNTLNFWSHIRNLCKKASQKILTLSRVSNLLNDFEKNLIFNAVLKTQFNYYPLFLDVLIKIIEQCDW